MMAPIPTTASDHLAAEGWTVVKRQIAGAYHRPSAEYLTAYWNEARWRADNVANENAFRETVHALITTEPLTYRELIQSDARSQRSTLSH